MERPAVHITAPVFLATPGQREPQAAREADTECEREKRQREKKPRGIKKRPNQLDFTWWRQEHFKGM